MTGTFELFADENMSFRFRLKAKDGTVMALSRSFPDKPAAVAGITAVREYAGMGLITDLCPEIPAHGSPPRSDPAPPIMTPRYQADHSADAPGPAVHRNNAA
ncbi:YegP family protein [Arthrobacter sp. 2MCAF14]|uniref:YegP family protein n=1 Tax=Arthrobacter sp. 2MCAF14 TaxID=3232982 RepID=UPI003F93EC8C